MEYVIIGFAVAGLLYLVIKIARNSDSKGGHGGSGRPFPPTDSDER